MKIPKYVMLKPDINTNDYQYKHLSHFNIYEVSGRDRRAESEYEFHRPVLCVFDDVGGISSVYLDDIVEVSYDTVQLAKVLFK